MEGVIYLDNQFSMDHSLTKIEKLNMILGFVQEAILYKRDQESQSLINAGINKEYCRFSRETLFDQEGDCDCKSELTAALLAADRCRVAYCTTKDHAFIGLSSTDFCTLQSYLPDYFIDIRGEHFMYCETTGTGWMIGKVPDGFNRNEIQEVEIIDCSI